MRLQRLPMILLVLTGCRGKPDWVARRHGRWACAAVLLAGITSASCEFHEFSSGTELLGDTVVVRSATPLLRDTLHPIERVRVGSLDGPESHLFTAVGSFAVGFDGSLFIYDHQDGIRQFDPDGGFRQQVARFGEGPGEVGHVAAMDVDAQGRLIAVDLGNDRVTRFDLVADSVASFPRPRWRRRWGDGSIRFHTDGSLWMGVHPTGLTRGGARHPRVAFLRLTLDGSVVETRSTPPGAAAVCTTLSEPEYRRGFWEDTREPFLPKTTWAYGPDGTFAVGCPADYILDIHKPSGGVIRIHRGWSPLLIQGEVRERMTTQAGINPIPRRRPAYARIILPGDGRVWVWPNQPIERFAYSPEWAARAGRDHGLRIASTGAFDVFESTGRWLATVRLPPGARFSGFPNQPNVFIRGDTIWAIATDSLDVESVIRYEVPELSIPSNQ